MDELPLNRYLFLTYFKKQQQQQQQQQGEGNTEVPGENLSEQGREPTTNSTHIWRRR